MTIVRNIVVSVFLILPAFMGFAGEIGEGKARNAAQNFMVSRMRNVEPNLVRITHSYTHRIGGTAIYHVIFTEPVGWVIVSASDATVPILAYSFENNWSADAPPAAFTAWTTQYQKTIQAVIASGKEASPEILNKWNHLLQPENLIEDDHKGFLSIEPLITSDWNQSPYYNEYCPADPAGPLGHAVAGCVPVCMGQVMYYFRWPLTGTGSYSYTDPTYGVQSADFGATSYLWNNMKNKITSSNPGIAELIYHLGVSCDLQYGPDGSGMYNHKAAYALRTFFKYSPQTQYLFRDSTTLNWDSVLIAHLERKIPMYYAGWDVPNISGHAFVCDGYQDSSFFHFNFGWGGSNNGYFYTSDLTPGSSNFQLAQEVIINCFPDTANYVYPVFCQEEASLAYTNGSIEDGSGPVNDYQPGTDCQWLIDPQTDTDSVTSITLSFSRFNTSPDDLLRIFDGADTNAPLLGSFSGSALPPPVTSTGNKMLLTFHAEDDTTGAGFLSDYSSLIPVWCDGTTSITADTLELSDGSFRFNYNNGSNCRWRLQTTDSQPLTIHFRSFDTEPDKDLMRIYDLGSEDTLAILSGSYSPSSLPDSVTAPSGKMFIIFTSNSSLTAGGWEIYYPKIHAGIDDPGLLRDIQVYPNPASSFIQIVPQKPVHETCKIELINSTGSIVLLRHTTIPASGLRISLEGIAPGLNILRISGSDLLVNRKIVVK